MEGKVLLFKPKLKKAPASLPPSLPLCFSSSFFMLSAVGWAKPWPVKRRRSWRNTLYTLDSLRKLMIPANWWSKHWGRATKRGKASPERGFSSRLCESSTVLLLLILIWAVASLTGKSARLGQEFFSIMFDCVEALGVGQRPLFDVSAQSSCMLRKASSFFSGLEPFSWSNNTSLQCKCLFTVHAYCTSVLLSAVCCPLGEYFRNLKWLHVLSISSCDSWLKWCCC